jgi:3-oxoacyl-[acyl-carrier protein] reductase
LFAFGVRAMLDSMGSLEGRVALVTGSSRGIGKAVALRLAKDGATVVVNYHRSEDAARDIAAALEDIGGAYLMVRGNVALAADAKHLVAETLHRFRRLDILVNNAGIFRGEPLPALAEDDVRAVMDTNFLGTFLVTREASSEMIKNHYGRIVNISSIAAALPWRGQANYAASKGAVEAFTRSCALELGRKGITVNAVAPGAIRSEMMSNILHVGDKQLAERTVVKRLGEPADVAAAVSFLASEEASFITGQILTVDGGFSIG